MCYAADLQEVLKMSISILQGLAAEWDLLYHVDESWFKFKTAISDVHLQHFVEVLMVMDCHYQIVHLTVDAFQDPFIGK